jgi:phosphotransferase system enzyme I (PtsI)
VEENPFLGWRGIRMSLDVPELFKPQLRAILRAAAHGNLKVMFPMIADVEELRSARRVFDECRRELESEGHEIGPVAAAILASELAPEVSFFSIGTNDLVQYTLAADRGNERLRHLQSADHPAVLELVKMTCEAARERGIWVGVCGEAAGEPALIPKLVELGVTELSMSAPSIPRAKKVVTWLTSLKSPKGLRSALKGHFTTSVGWSISPATLPGKRAVRSARSLAYSA